jgi:hypothetical protein
MANVSIPSHGVREPSERQLAHARVAREKREEEARQRASTIDAPWYNDKMDPNNFGRDDLDPTHVAMFNGAAGGRRAASFPERTLDTGLHFHPTPSPLTSASGGREVASPHHPEILTSIIQELWTPSTSYGALGQALAVATDSPPSISGPSEPPLTIAPPLDPEDLPEPPPEDIIAPEGSRRQKLRADWAEAAASEDASRPQPSQQPAKKPAEEEAKRQRDEEKKRQEEQRRDRDRSNK